MSPQNASAPAWHPPMIFEFKDITRTPLTGQLSLSTGNPGNPYNGYKVKNRNEHEAELSNARVGVHRERQVDILPDGEKKPHPRSCCTVAYDGDFLDMLVQTGQILDHETEDAKEVGKAISELLADWAQDWKKNRKKF